MRYEPEQISQERLVAQRQLTTKLTRKAALVLAFVSVFYFFIKLLFL